MSRPSRRIVTLLALALLMGGCTRAPEPAGLAPANRRATDTSTPAPALGNPIEGTRLATIAGCNGCHGPDAAGKVFVEIPGVLRLVAPNLTQRRTLYDDAALASLLRGGRTHDGHRPIGMPIMMFQHFSDQDIRDITAWLRATPAVANPVPLPASWLSDKLEKSLADGTDPYALDDQPDSGNRPPAIRPSEPLALGRHVAMTSCPECHGRTLDGRPGDDAPSLMVAKSYTSDKFVRLMKTGITATGKESASGLMTEMARRRYSSLTDAEISALKLYLDTR